MPQLFAGLGRTQCLLVNFQKPKVEWKRIVHRLPSTSEHFRASQSDIAPDLWLLTFGSLWPLPGCFRLCRLRYIYNPFDGPSCGGGDQRHGYLFGCARRPLSGLRSIRRPTRPIAAANADGDVLDRVRNWLWS